MNIVCCRKWLKKNIRLLVFRVLSSNVFMLIFFKKREFEINLSLSKSFLLNKSRRFVCGSHACYAWSWINEQDNHYVLTDNRLTSEECRRWHVIGFGIVQCNLFLMYYSNTVYYITYFMCNWTSLYCETRTSCAPVSYTHLDVYKRQLWRSLQMFF